MRGSFQRQAEIADEAISKLWNAHFASGGLLHALTQTHASVRNDELVHVNAEPVLVIARKLSTIS